MVVSRSAAPAGVVPASKEDVAGEDSVDGELADCGVSSEPTLFVGGTEVTGSSTVAGGITVARRRRQNGAGAPGSGRCSTRNNGASSEAPLSPSPVWDNRRASLVVAPGTPVRPVLHVDYSRVGSHSRMKLCLRYTPFRLNAKEEGRRRPNAPLSTTPT